MEKDGEVEESLSVVMQKVKDLKLGPLAEQSIVQVKAGFESPFSHSSAFNSLCMQENKLLAIQKAKRTDDNAHAKEVEDAIKEVRSEISLYMEHLAKVPHEEVVKAMQTQPASKEEKRKEVKREVESYDVLVVEEGPSYEPLPFRAAVAPSRTEGIENRRAEVSCQ